MRIRVTPVRTCDLQSGAAPCDVWEPLRFTPQPNGLVVGGPALDELKRNVGRACARCSAIPTPFQGWGFTSVMARRRLRTRHAVKSISGGMTAASNPSFSRALAATKPEFATKPAVSTMSRTSLSTPSKRVYRKYTSGRTPNSTKARAILRGSSACTTATSGEIVAVTSAAPWRACQPGTRDSPGYGLRGIDVSVGFS